MSGIYGVTEWITRFAVINILWLLFNLPVVLIIINAIYMQQQGVLFFIVVLLAIIAPFIFFPATTAMFASVRDWVLQREAPSLIKNYLKYYKENYRRSLVGGIILTLIWLIWGVDYYYFSTVNVILMFAFIIMGVFLFVFTINFFSVLAHYELKIRSLLKTTLIITVGSPILLLTVAIGSGIILYVSFNGLLFLLLFFTGSLISFISFSAFYRLYDKLTQKTRGT
jgi:uncharacterized membrane protein YesL